MNFGVRIAYHVSRILKPWRIARSVIIIMILLHQRERDQHCDLSAKRSLIIIMVFLQHQKRAHHYDPSAPAKA
jgi:hypothetical protein